MLIQTNNQIVNLNFLHKIIQNVKFLKYLFKQDIIDTLHDNSRVLVWFQAQINLLTCKRQASYVFC